MSSQMALPCPIASPIIVIHKPGSCARPRMRPGSTRCGLGRATEREDQDPARDPETEREDQDPMRDPGHAPCATHRATQAASRAAWARPRSRARPRTLTVRDPSRIAWVARPSPRPGSARPMLFPIRFESESLSLSLSLSLLCFVCSESFERATHALSD